MCDLTDKTFNNELNEKILLTKDMQEKINTNRTSEDDKIKAHAIGRAVRRLGFMARHTKKGNGYLYDTERLDALVKSYLGLKNASTPSTASPDSPETQFSNVVANFKDSCSRTCVFCGKPIEGDIHDHIGDLHKSLLTWIALVNGDVQKATT